MTVVVKEDFDRLNLDTFLKIADFDTAYEFPNVETYSSQNRSILKNLINIKFSSFNEFITGFEYLENEACLQKFSKNDVRTILKLVLGSNKFSALLRDIFNNDNITNMLQIKVLLARKLFKNDFLTHAKCTSRLCKMGEKLTVYQAIAEFRISCRDYVFSCLCFKEKNKFSEKDLCNFLLIKLPISATLKLKENANILTNLQELLKMSRGLGIMENNMLGEANEIERNRAIQNVNNNGPYRNSSRIICHCCGKRGHIKKNCRFRLYRCFKCNKIGHIMNVCRSQSNTYEETDEKSSISENINNTRVMEHSNDRRILNLYQTGISAEIENFLNNIENDLEFRRALYEAHQRDENERRRQNNRRRIRNNRRRRRNNRRRTNEVVRETDSETHFVNSDDSVDQNVSMTERNSETYNTSETYTEENENDEIDIFNDPSFLQMNSNSRTRICVFPSRGAGELGVPVESNNTPVEIETVYIPDIIPLRNGTNRRTNINTFRTLFY